MKPRPVVAPRLILLALEDRVVPSAAPQLSVASGVLTIKGTNFDDSVVVQDTANGTEVWSDDQLLRRYKAGKVKSIVFQGNAGEDFFQNDSLRKSTASGGKGDDVLIGGFGNDALKGNAGDDLLMAWSGDNRFEGGAGLDLLLCGVGRDRMLDLREEDVVVAFALTEFVDAGWGGDLPPLAALDFGDPGYDPNEFYLDESTFVSGLMDLIAGVAYGAGESTIPYGWDVIEGIPTDPTDSYLPWGWDSIGGEPTNPYDNFIPWGWDSINGVPTSPYDNYLPWGWDSINGVAVDPGDSSWLNYDPDYFALLTIAGSSDGSGNGPSVSVYYDDDAPRHA